MRTITVLAPALLALGLCVPVLPTAADPAPRYEQTRPSRDGIGKRYMGREVAGVMGWQAAGWLERQEREREERASLLVKSLELRAGMVIADVGAGTGYYARRFAKEVSPGGRVYAVDVQPEMLRLLQSLAQGPEYQLIEPVLGAVDDVRLPEGVVDLAVMVDVYHELEFPHEVLASVVRALKPQGRVLFVEYRGEDDSVPIKPLHKMTVAQIRREAEAHGLVLKHSIRGLPWQHALLFGRGSGPAQADQKPPTIESVAPAK